MGRPTGPRPVRLDLTGKKIPGSLWTVIDRNFDQTRKPTDRGVFWNCVCECGQKRVIKTGNLVYGLSKSCGCRVPALTSKAKTVHGKSRTQIYRCWINMKCRCTLPGHTEWINYGGRGITVCPQWMDSFETFYADVGDPPSKKHTLDRINVDGNYEPGNVRWATRAEQALNKRKIARLDQYTTAELIGELKRRGVLTF